MKLWIGAAISVARREGKKMNKQIIAEKLWPNSSYMTRAVNMTKLVSGKTKSIKIEWINTICKMTGVDPNFLLNYDE